MGAGSALFAGRFVIGSISIGLGPTAVVVPDNILFDGGAGCVPTNIMARTGLQHKP